MNNLKEFTIHQSTLLIEALKKIDCNKKGFLIVTDNQEKVVGTLTDGDIRRSFINGCTFENMVNDAQTKEFKYLSVKDNLMNVVDIFKNEKINFIPILDENKGLYNVITKKQLHSLLLLDLHADLKFDFSSLDENVVDYEIYQRPWGFYKTTVMNQYFQSKIISVRPKGQLSLQSHNRREEYWVIGYGKGTVQIDDSIIPVTKGSSMFIPKGAKHRLTNTDSEESLIITEVQIGDYFGEDDIIRYDDIYGRVVTEDKKEINKPIEDYTVNYSTVEIKMLLTDCDGCLTDGGMYYSEKGDELKRFNAKDGMGFSFLRNFGIITGIITGEDVQLNRRRAEKLKLDILESGCKDKLEIVKKYCKEYGIALENVCYIGDDINDIEVLGAVGVSCCPADAAPEVKAVAKCILETQGGQGVIREVINRFIK